MKKQKNKGKNNIVTADFEKRRGDRNQKLHAIPTQAPLKCLTATQNDYRKSILKNQITFGIGPAGTGKTYVAVAVAISALLNRKVEKIIITRPAVEAGETLGFLPGKLADKFAPYLAPMRNVFHERLGQSHYEGMLKSGRIVAYPLAYMRGESFDGSFIIADEAQNMTENQLKMVLTRIGRGSKLVIDGDPDQTDLEEGSGLLDTVDRVSSIRGVNAVYFDSADIVRSDIVADILAAYSS